MLVLCGGMTSPVSRDCVRVVERRFEAGVDESCCEVGLEYWEVMHDEGDGVSWEICVAGGSGGRSGGGDDIAGA